MLQQTKELSFRKLYVRKTLQVPMVKLKMINKLNFKFLGYKFIINKKAV